MPKPADDAPYTAEEVAAKLRVTSRAIQKWCAAGRFPGAYKLGDATSPWRIPPQALEEFLKETARSSPKA